jgi:putative DNA primase/helicase
MYGPTATCPAIEKFISEIVPEEDRQLLIEIPAYSLWREYPVQKAVMLVGEGANGKSTYLSLVSQFLGVDNVASVSLQSLISNRFAGADLYRKLANIHADLPNVALKNPGFFKMLTGSDLCRAERKFKDAFQFRNYAKLLFSTNEIPFVDDETDAFFRRWIIINFPYKFTGQTDDKQLIKKLTTPEELSGLLNLVLPILPRIVEGGFSYHKTTDEIRRIYKEFSSSISRFGYNCIVQSDDDYIQKDDLYEAYRKYCRAEKLTVESSDKFFKHIKNDFPVSDYRPQTPGRPSCFKGIRLVDAPNPQNTLTDGDDNLEKH